MPVEQRDPEEVLRKMQDFTMLGTARGINNFVLRGPIDVPTIFHTFASLYTSYSRPEQKFAILGTREGVKAKDIYEKILQLQISERVKKIGIKDERPLREVLERLMEAASMPTVMAAFGEAQPSQAEVITLFSIAGISPESALRELQKKVRERRGNKS